jgi:hypothetical protein
MKITPGPWYINDRTNVFSNSNVDGDIAHMDGFLIADCNMSYMSSGFTTRCDDGEEHCLSIEERYANASLIAAAPRMLDALRQLVMQFDLRLQAMPEGPDEFEEAAMADAKEVLAGLELVETGI